MNWYLSTIVFRVLIGTEEQTARFDEQLRIITAASKEEAFAKAQQLGIAEEGTVMNVYNSKPVEWKFINVSTLYQLKELLDGAEICSTTREPECADTYIAMVHSKAAHINHGETLEMLQLV